MKVAVIGAGAMGSLFGGRLARAGVQAILYDVYREHIQAVQGEGLAIEDAASGEIEICRPEATVEPEIAAQADFLLVFVKSSATASVAAQFAAIAPPEAVAVTVQNGLGNEGTLKRHFGAGRTAAGVTSQGATFLGPGRIRHAGSGPTHLCMSDKANERLAPLVEALNAAGLPTEIEGDIESLVWSKLLINVGINALTALLGVPNGRLLELPESRELMAGLIAEAQAVAEARGIALTYPDPLAAVQAVAEKTGRNRSSMLQDFDRCRPSEIDVINGAIVREAEAAGIPVPVNRTVTALVRALDRLHSQESA